MTTKFGWCQAAIGFRPKHSECKVIAVYYVDAKPREIKCGCECHARKEVNDDGREERMGTARDSDCTPDPLGDAGA